ncbi:TonB-dependent receptor [Niveispirillum cyanobacteriorum]|nr:TonB-dependent receptor [Niveispirillum cyanobacteriorum]GGE88614.1 hypothetical protein GCM10011317_52060 [Niveispirillum cyanobacteriorum]
MNSSHWTVGVKYGVATVALLTAAPAMPAWAQNDALALEEIVVTAQRRGENLQAVPLSVTAVTSDGLERRGITDITKLEAVTPGFTFGRSGSDARPAMRGVRTENVGVNGDTTIGYFIDGIYQSRASQAMSSFVDLERVEVQRGPQGTLYGRNTFGGNISIITASPVLDATLFGGSLTLAEYGKVRAEGYANAPIGDKAALRIAATRDKSNGYVRNDNNKKADLFDDDLSYVRAALALEPTEALKITLRGDYADEGGNGGSAFGYKLLGSYYDPATCQRVFNATALVLNTRPGNLDGVDDCPGVAGVQDLGIPIHKADDPFRIDQNYRTFRKSEKKGFSGDIVYDLGPVSLRSITGYSDFNLERTSDSDFSASTIGLDYQSTEAETFSQELQVLSDYSGPLRYVAGVYYFKDELRGLFVNQQLPRIVNGVATGVTGAGFYDDQYSETESYAVYAQGTYAVTDELSFTAGARYTEDHKSFKFLRPALQNSSIAIGVTPPNIGTTNQPDVTFDKVTWRLAADYQVAEDSLLYASVSTGFRSGGYNTRTEAAVFSFDPETVTAFEVGSKNRFLDNRLQLNIAAFFNDYKKLQEQRQVPVGNTTASIIFNSAEAESYGVEVEAEWLVTDAFSLGGSLSLLSAEYTSFMDAPLPGGFANPVGAGGVINNALVPVGYTCRIVPGSPNNAYGCDLSGKKIPYSPSWSGSVFTSYRIDLDGAGSLTPLAVLSFSDDFYGQPFNSKLERTNSYAKLDLSAAWENADGNVTVRAYVDNVTDKKVKNRTVWGGGGALQASYAPPQTFGLKITYRE